MRTTCRLGVFVALLTAPLILPSMRAAAQTPVPERKLELSFNAGRVTLIAHNVTLREILAEWGRQGNCQVINGDKIVGGTVMYEFRERPELEVMASLLRSVPGFLLEARRVGGVGASQLQAIRIQPKSGPAVGYSSPPMTSSVAVPLQTQGTPDDLPTIQPVSNGDPKTAPGANQPVVIKPFTPLPNGGRGGSD